MNTKVNFTGLIYQLTQLTGVRGLTIEGRIHNDRDRWKLEFQSSNFVEQCGVLAPAYKSVNFQDFGSGYDDVEKRFMVQVNYAYRMISGGGNGCELGGWYYYPETETWEKFR